MTSVDIADGVQLFEMTVFNQGQVAQIYPNGLNVVDILIKVCVISGGNSIRVTPSDVTLIYAQQPTWNLREQDLLVGKWHEDSTDYQFTRTQPGCYGWFYSNKPGRFDGGNASDSGAGLMNNPSFGHDVNGLPINYFHFYVYCNNDRDASSCLVGARLNNHSADPVYIDASKDVTGEAQKTILIETKKITPYTAEDFHIKCVHNVVTDKYYVMHNSYFSGSSGDLKITQWQLPTWSGPRLGFMGSYYEQSNRAMLHAKFVANMDSPNVYDVNAKRLFWNMEGYAKVNDPAYAGALCFPYLYMPNIAIDEVTPFGQSVDCLFSVWDKYGNVTHVIWAGHQFDSSNYGPDQDPDYNGNMFYIAEELVDSTIIG